MRSRPEIAPEIEDYRDARWRREGTRQIESAFDAERFIEQVGFAACLTDCRRPGPSLYVAVCGRRDAVMPRNVQKDSEASLTWTSERRDRETRQGLLREARARQGDVHRAAHDSVLSRRLGGAPIGREAAAEPERSERSCKVLRREWEMSTSDLRDESGVKNRQAFTRGAGRTSGGDDRDAERGASISRSSPTSGRLASDGFPTRCAAASAGRRRCAKSRAAFSPERA